MAEDCLEKFVSDGHSSFQMAIFCTNWAEMYGPDSTLIDMYLPIMQGRNSISCRRFATERHHEPDQPLSEVTKPLDRHREQLRQTKTEWIQKLVTLQETETDLYEFLGIGEN
uniref:Uncharacterized protein n=1 Tax=Lygus hesperus TaxID=30085 RepID=A0A0A9YKD1_LYGHE